MIIILIANIRHYDVKRRKDAGNLIKINSWMNDITAFLMYCLRGKMDMGRVVAGMDWQIGDLYYLCDSCSSLMTTDCNY